MAKSKPVNHLKHTLAAYCRHYKYNLKRYLKKKDQKGNYYGVDASLVFGKFYANLFQRI
jgi:hypothetical protein